MRVRALDGHRVVERPDKLATEEPMEIRVHGPGQEPRALAVTMRTPGNDFELAVGFCRTEGILANFDELDTVAYCVGGEGTQEYNVVTVRLRRPVDDREAEARRFAVNASCGICGKATLDDVEQHCAPVATGPTVARSVLASLPELLRAEQRVFDATGGLHASAVFDRDGTLLSIREDIGRHNALDKIVGHALLEQRLPLSSEILLVSGRVSFEIVQKAAMAGIPVMCAVSAPSSLAVDAADRLGQTLVGFLRGGRANVYTHPERIDLDR